jgi:hypothetical protein
MRKQTDLCLLCKANLATKSNSHIFPRFLSTHFLGEKETARKGFILKSNEILKNRPKPIQDSPKENYILCEECETYLGVLEDIARDTFIDWKVKVHKGEFTLNQIIEELDIVECNTSNKKTIHLFIYSIFWRVSISSIDLFENVKISQEFGDELRTILMNYKQTKKRDYLNSLNKLPFFKIFPTSIITAKLVFDKRANMLFVPFSYDPYCIVVDRYAFMLFKTKSDIKQDFLKAFCNIEIEDCKMMVFSEQLWYDIILKKPFELLANKVLELKKID